MTTICEGERICGTQMISTIALFMKEKYFGAIAMKSKKFEKIIWTWSC